MKFCKKCRTPITDKNTVPYHQSKLCIKCYRKDANEQAKYYYQKTRKLKPQRDLICEWCKEPFSVPAQNTSKTCSVECRKKRKNQRERARKRVNKKENM